MSAATFIGVPTRIHTREELVGTLEKIEGSLVVLVEGEDGVTLVLEDGMTSERVNWMLDRAKFMLHRCL